MIKVGILGCSEIAFRRFMPAVLHIKNIDVKVVAEEYDIDKLEPFCSKYGLERETSFCNLINRDDLDAVYIPQPPALHYKWAKYALECGKHVLVEKPSTTEYKLTEELVEIAKSRSLALHENYMFQYHSQIKEIQSLIEKGTVGEVRLYRANFGFPLREKNDFRYNASLGGGALLDAGGYTVKLASILLGDTIKVDSAHLLRLPNYEVDMYGNAVLSNDNNVTCQIAFGMDCHYQCCLEVWGSKGWLYTDRIFTAPPEFEPTVVVKTANGTEHITLTSDVHFQHSIETFCEEIIDKNKRNKMYDEILLQSRLIESIAKCERY